MLKVVFLCAECIIEWHKILPSNCALGKSKCDTSQSLYGNSCHKSNYGQPQHSCFDIFLSCRVRVFALCIHPVGIQTSVQSILACKCILQMNNHCADNLHGTHRLHFISFGVVTQAKQLCANQMKLKQMVIKRLVSRVRNAPAFYVFS